MIGSEEDLLLLSDIDGFKDIEEIMDHFMTKDQVILFLQDEIANLKLHQLKNKNNTPVYETCAVMINKVKKEIEAYEKLIEELRTIYLENMNKYKLINGEDSSYKKLEAIYNNEFYILIENEYSMHYGEEEYLVDLNSLHEKNEEKKIMLKKLAILDMKKYDEEAEEKGLFY